MSKLKIRRLEKGYSQEKLAYEAGVTVRYIAFLEADKRNPSISLAFKIATILNTTVDDIFLPFRCTNRT